MRQFPGLQEEVTKTVDHIKELYENAEDTLEGKKYADIMKYAFGALRTSDSVDLGLGASIDGRMIWNINRSLNDFLRYLNVKFGPKLVQFIGLSPMNIGVYYLKIPGTNFVFEASSDLDRHAPFLKLWKKSPHGKLEDPEKYKKAD